MQVACRSALAGQPLGLGREGTDLRIVDRRAKYAERGPQAAQRDAGLMDADRPPALQHDVPVFRQIGPA